MPQKKVAGHEVEEYSRELARARTTKTDILSIIERNIYVRHGVIPVEEFCKYSSDKYKEYIGDEVSHTVNIPHTPPKENPTYLVKRLNGGHYIFCGHCKEYGRAKIVAEEVNYHYESRDNSITYDAEGNYISWNERPIIQKVETEYHLRAYVCPHCNAEIPVLETKEVHTQKPDKEFIWAGPFNHGHIVRFKWIWREITAFNDKLQFNYYHRFISFNVESGQAYLMEPWCNGKRVVGCKEKKIQNITYNQDYFYDKLPGVRIQHLIPLYDMLYEKHKARLGYNPINLKELFFKQLKQQLYFIEQRKLGPIAPKSIYEQEEISEKILHFNISDMIAFNRMPTMDPRGYKKLVSMNRKTNKRHHFIVKSCISKIKNTCDNPIQAFLDLYKVTVSKSLRKVVTARPQVIPHVHIVQELFKQPNNQVKILSSESFSERPDIFKTESVVRFIKDMINIYGDKESDKIKGETNIANKILAEAKYYNLQDAARFYCKIKTKAPRWDIDCTGTLKEMHDRFEKMVKDLKDMNMPLLFTEEEKKLEGEYDGYTFRFAVDTDELKKVGTDMHICVGGYGDSALERNCNIMLAIKNDKYVCCIEMTGDLTNLRQVKTHCNYYPEGELLDAVMAWVKKNKLKTDGTHDIPSYTDYKKQKKENPEQPKLQDVINEPVPMVAGY